MISVWGLMAFIKASDERTYAAKRGGRRSAAAPAGDIYTDRYPDDPTQPLPPIQAPPRPRAAQPVQNMPQNTPYVSPRVRKMQVHIPEEELAPDKHRSGKAGDPRR